MYRKTAGEPDVWAARIRNRNTVQISYISSDLLLEDDTEGAHTFPPMFVCGFPRDEHKSSNDVKFFDDQVGAGRPSSILMLSIRQSSCRLPKIQSGPGKGFGQNSR